MQHLETLMTSAGIPAQNTIKLSPKTLDMAKEQSPKVTTMFKTLAAGDADGFVSQAGGLGIDKDQAQLAVRDTAALASMIMTLGMVQCW